MAQKESLYSYRIERFLGLNADESERSLKLGESVYMKNFRITDGFSLKKRDGYRLMHDFGGKVRAMFYTECDGECIFFVIGNSIFKAPLPFDAKKIETLGSVGDSENCFFLRFGGKIYLWGGGKIQVYDGESAKFGDIELYRPLVAISCDTDTGAGTPLEGVNMLTPKMRKQFPSRESSDRAFRVETEKCESIDYVKYLGAVVATNYYRVVPDNNEIVFTADFSMKDGVNTVEIGYTILESDAVKENYAKVTNCKYSMFYGGENDTKVFLWGNPDFPDARIWSEAVDGIPSATYFPENNFTRIGDGAEIRDIVRQYDRQLIFCENAAYLSYIEDKTDALGRSCFSFPVRTISDTKGSAICAQTRLVDNVPITLMRDGLYKWVSTAQRDERNTHKISSRIQRLLAEEDISSAKMYDRENRSELYVYFPCGHVYVYRYDIDVFFFYDNISAFDFCRDGDDNLYFCDRDGKFFMFDDIGDDNGRAIECEWQSGYTDMGYFGHKNLYSVAATFEPCDDTGFEIYWSTDIGDSNVGAAGLTKIAESANADNATFAVPTVKTVKRRVRTKRFRHLKLMIKDNSASHRIHLHAVTLGGKFTDI